MLVTVSPAGVENALLDLQMVVLAPYCLQKAVRSGSKDHVIELDTLKGIILVWQFPLTGLRSERRARRNYSSKL